MESITYITTTTTKKKIKMEEYTGLCGFHKHELRSPGTHEALYMMVCITMNNTENNLIKKNFVLFLDNKKFDAEALYCS